MSTDTEHGTRSEQAPDMTVQCAHRAISGSLLILPQQFSKTSHFYKLLFAFFQLQFFKILIYFIHVFIYFDISKWEWHSAPPSEEKITHLCASAFCVCSSLCSSGFLLHDVMFG